MHRTIVFYKLTFFCLLAVVFVFLLPADVLALAQPVIFKQYQGTATPMGDVLCRMASWAAGNIGKGLAIIGVAIIGIQSYRGEMKKTTALLGIVGIATIFGAIPIVMGISNFSGTGMTKMANQPTFSTNGISEFSYCAQWTF